MPIYDENDRSTWDVPEVIKPKSPVPTPPVKPPKGLQPAARKTMPQLEAAKYPDGDLGSQISYISKNTPAVPPAVALGIADGDLTPEDKKRAIHTIARRYDLSPGYFGFQEAGTGMYHNADTGDYMSVERAKNVLGAWDPKVVRGMINRLPTDDEQRVLTMNNRRRKFGHENPTQEDVLTIAAGLMTNPRMQNTSLETLMGTAIAIASSFTNDPGSQKLFVENLKQFKKETLLPWAAAVALAEQATIDGVTLHNAVEAFARYGTPGGELQGIESPTRANVLTVAARNSAIRVSEDGKQYIWNPFTHAYEELSAEDLTTVKQVQSPVRRGLAGPLGYTNYLVDPIAMTGDPSTWAPPEDNNVPSPDGGAHLDPTLRMPLTQQLLVAQAGFIPNFADLDRRPGDYYSNARAVARDMTLRDEAWSESPFGRTISKTLHAASAGWNHVWGTGVELTAVLTYPLAWLGYSTAAGGKSDADQYFTDMMGQAEEIESGHTTASYIAASNLQQATGMPEWTVPLMSVAADLLTAGKTDPFILSGSAFKNFQALHTADTLASAAEGGGFLLKGLNTMAETWNSERMRGWVDFLSREHNMPGLRNIEAIQEFAIRADQKLGIPLFARYASAGERNQVFIDMFVNRPRWWLGGKSIPAYLVSVHEIGDPSAFWRAANGRMRSQYARMPFSHEFTNLAYRVIEVGKNAGLAEEEIVGKIKQLLVSGFGGKALDRNFFRDMVYEELPKEVRSTIKSPGTSIAGVGGKPRPGFATFDEVTEWEQLSGRTAFNANRGIPRRAIGTRVEFTGYDINDVLARADQFEHSFIPEGTRYPDMLRGGPPSGALRYRNTLPDLPKYSTLRSLRTRGMMAATSDTELGHAWRAVATGMPMPEVSFEAGRYEKNVAERLGRSRVFSQEETDKLVTRAAEISRADNPTREPDMIAFLEDMNNKTWDRVAAQYGLEGDLSETVKQIFMDASEGDKKNFDRARSYGIKYERDAEGNIVGTRTAKTPQGTTQLTDRWFVPDPLAMRRTIRSVVGDVTSFRQWMNRLSRERAVRSSVLPGELEASAERTGYQTQLYSVLDRLGYTEGQKEWYMRIVDQSALSALEFNPDRFATADDFFSSIKVGLGSDAARQPALFQIGTTHRVGSAEAADISGFARMMPEAEPGMLYHTTTLEGARSIARTELRTTNSWWPDGALEERIYFSHKPSTTMHFGDQEKAVLLRTADRSVYGHDLTNPDYRFANWNIAPEKLEFYGADGKWHNLAEYDGTTGDQLFQRIIESDPDYAQWNTDIKAMLESGDLGEHTWYEASRKTIEDLGHLYLTGTTKLADGREISDVKLFTAILAVQSPQKTVAQDLEDTLNWFIQFKAAGGDASRVPTEMKSIEDSIRDIMAGSREFTELTPTMQQAYKAAGYGPGDIVDTTPEGWSVFNDAPAPVTGTGSRALNKESGAVAFSNRARPKTWSFYHNLIGDAEKVTVDTWMARIFGYDKQFSEIEYFTMTDKVKAIAAEHNITPMQAQAAMWVIYKGKYATKLDNASNQLRLAADAARAGDAAGAERILDAVYADRDAIYYLGTDRIPVDSPGEMVDMAGHLKRQVPVAREANSFEELASQPGTWEKFEEIGSLNEQIKSGDVGRFLEQRRSGTVLGSTEFGPDGDALMRFYAGANTSTLTHELGHVIRQIMPAEDIAVFERELGLKFGSLGDVFDRGYKGTFGRTGPTARSIAAREAEEKFAALIETYFETGKAPASTLPVLERLRDFLSRIWESIRGTKSATAVPAESQAILERWFGPATEARNINSTGARILTESDLMLDKEGLDAVRAHALKIAQHSAETYIKYWKLPQVLRPAYVFRVPGFDEQIRFLSEFGLSNRFRAQGVVGKVAKWSEGHGMPEGWTTQKIVIPTKEGNPLVVDRKMPGLLHDEKYVESQATGENAFATFAEQQNAIANNKVLEQTYGEVAPPDSKLSGRKIRRGEKTYAGAAETAINGHISESPHGYMALQDIANGVDPEASAAGIAKFFREDTIGQSAAERMGLHADDADEFAKDYVDMVRRYTFADPDIAEAGMHRQFTGDMLKSHLDKIGQTGEEWLIANRLAEPRALTALDRDIDAMADAVRLHIKNHGGFTMDPVTGKMHTGGGYGVGILEETAHKFSEAALEDKALFREEFRTFIDKPGVRESLESYKEGRLGGWVDNGDVHLDPSVVTDYDSARGISYARKQEGFADFDHPTETGAPDFIPTDERPTFHGLKADTMSGKPLNPFRPIVDTVSKGILQAPTNRWSRQPFQKAWYDRMLVAQIEQAKAAGFFPETYEDAQRMIKSFEANARRFAIERTNAIMFDIRDQGRFSEMLWFAAPFTQPFFEAFSVYSKLLRRNPALAGWVNRVVSSSLENGMIKRDENGQLVVPMSNWLGIGPLMRIMNHFDLGLSVPLSSFNLFFNNALPISTAFTGDINLPFPGFSPPMQWVVQQLIPDESTSRLATWAQQYGPVGLKELSPFPSWLQNAFQAFSKGGWDPQQYKAYVESFMQMNQHSGMTFDNADDAVAYAEGQANVFFRWKTGISLLFPGAPSIEFPQKELQLEYANLIETEGPLAARDIFLDRHPDQWLIVTAKTVWEQSDPNLPADFSAIPTPANRIADTILAMPGIKEFAAENPWWAWSLLPPEAFGTDAYDPDSFRKQLALTQRSYLEPRDFYAKGEASAGWHAYWGLTEWWTAKKEFLSSSNVSDTDPEYLAAKAEYDKAKGEILSKYPGFADTFGSAFGESDPRPILYAQELVKSDVFMSFPIGKSVSGYLDLRAVTLGKMSEFGITSLDTVAAAGSGVLAEYDAAVQALIADNPQFEQVYNIFFSNDLRGDIPNKGLEEYANLTPEVQTAVAEWQREYNGIQDDLGIAIDQATKTLLYAEENKIVNKAYTDYGDVNPATIWWDSQGYTRRKEITERARTKPYLYLNRFERETVLGETTNDATETAWEQYNASRNEIYQRDQADPNFDAGPEYEGLNGWLRDQAASNPILATQIQHANTWGYEFWAGSGVLDAPGDAGQAWASIQNLTWSIMAQVRQLGLHGGDYDTDYKAAKAEVISQVKDLLARNPEFKTSWNYYESLSSSNLIDTLFPPVDYPI